MQYIKATVFLFFISSINIQAQNNFSYLVNPMIGTGGHGHTFPGVVLPHGMVQLSPDTRIDGSWDGCSGYHYSDSIIYGFSHTHLSGTGCSDYGDIMIMPTVGNLSLSNKEYASHFSHTNENAGAGYYKVHLDDYNIDVELTATLRTGFHKYTFNNDGKAYIILDLTHRDKLIKGSFKSSDKKSVEVYRRSEAWAKDQSIYAHIEFSKEVIEEENIDNEKAWFAFSVKKGESIYVKVALSGVDEEGAKRNMAAELSHWDFEKIKQEATLAWNNELNKIEVRGGTNDEKIIFYTALYHSAIHPSLFSDVDGRYTGRDFKIHTAVGFDYYTVFSLWDTFRAAHPLFTLIDEKRTVDYIKTFLAQYEQVNILPVWELSSNETECMIGYHSVSVLADAITKELKGFDYVKSFKAMKESALSRNRYGLGAYIDKGFLEIEDEHESVSKTLEYAYDDWCIAQVAKLLNKKEDYNTFMHRSQSWKNLFDKEKGFIRPRKNGGWLNPFEPHEVNNNYTEANAWQYTFFVPQDVAGMINALGGNDKFENKLDELFTTSSQTKGREQADITGLIGQYAHGNEPSHNMAYLYNYINKPWKTTNRIHQILKTFYKNSPDGLIGNEDCGQMSAWYVMSAIGLYQVCPGNPNYQITPSIFSEVIIHLAGNKKTKLICNDPATSMSFINNVKHNNKTIGDVNQISHAQLKEGGQFEMFLSDSISLAAMTNQQSQHIDINIIPVPIIEAIEQVFSDSLLIEIKTAHANETAFYAINKNKFVQYSVPFYIYQSMVIEAFSKTSEEKSKTSTSKFYKLPHPDWKIKINSIYNLQYTAGGDKGIIDGLRGDENWRKGNWQGYQVQNFNCVIDLGKLTNIYNVSACFLQDSRSWILMPLKVSFYFSQDGINFTDSIEIKNTIEANDFEVQTKIFSSEMQKQSSVRFVKIIATNYGTLPAWHQGAGGEAFIFIDEIKIR